jgi:homoserine dehydrogenase
LKAGILGAGSVGMNVVRYLFSHPSELLDLRWIANSRMILKRKDGGELGRKNLRTILNFKKSNLEGVLSEEDSELELIKFADLSHEINALKSETDGGSKGWIVIDTSYIQAEKAYNIVASLLGCAGYVTANKTPLANYEMCRKLYCKAVETKTLLGLNCTVGVWADQMEYIPLFLKILNRKDGHIEKRDNSSLNLFFTKVGSGSSPKEALAEVVAGGYLEPGAVDLTPEVKDQLIKLKVASNVSSAISGFAIKTSEKELEKTESSLVTKAGTKDLANWHLSGRKNGTYPALVSGLNLLGSAEKIESSIQFTELQARNMLARDFKGKNAISISFAGGRGFVHSGFGGSRRTAKMLVWEADRIARLSSLHDASDFDPMPILKAIKANDPDAISKRSALLSKVR